MEQFTRQSVNQVLVLSPADEIGRGGEAVIYAVPGNTALVAKIYHASRRAGIPTRKLSLMIDSPPADPMAGQGHASIAWPADLLLTANGDVTGFLMPRVIGMHPVIDFYHPATRKKQCPLFTWQYLLRTARNLAAAVRALHLRGYVIGDVNESNILVSDTALVTLVDTDSFQVRDPGLDTIYRCLVGKPDFTPPELQGVAFRDIDRTPDHDRFGLAVLIFKLLMEGTHPFDGVYSGQGDPPLLEKRIEAGYYPHGSRTGFVQPKPSAPPFGNLPPSLQALFTLCFEAGHSVPAARPDALAWQHALDEAETHLTTCTINAQHSYSGHLTGCPWCERTSQLNGLDAFPSQHDVLTGAHLDRTPLAQKPLPSAGTPAAPTPAAPTVSAPRPQGGRTALSPASAPPVRRPQVTRKPVRIPRSLLWIITAFGSVTAVIAVLLLRPPYKPAMERPAIATALLQSRKNTKDSAEMVWIPGGTAASGDSSQSDNPRHKVTLSGYWIYKYPVTVAQYEKFCRETHRSMPPGPNFNPNWSKKEHPIVKVSWNDAQDYCRWAGVSLPTEAQWEHAARGLQDFGFPWGNVFDGSKLWYSTESKSKLGTASVFRSSRVNISSFGCVDMAGNVLEWCQDAYEENFWKNSSRAPDPLNNPMNLNLGELRILRGGSWNYGGADNYRNSRRYRNVPDIRNDVTGFRCAAAGS